MDELEQSASRRKRRIIFGAIAVAVVGVLLFIGLRPAPAQRVAPSFSLPRLNGKGSISSAQLRGKPVVVNFFASWCVPCREEAPLLARIYKQYRNRGVDFLGVNVQDTRSSARAFLQKYGIDYPVVTDYSLTYAQQMKVPGLPITYFIDRDGHFLSSARGQKLGVQHSGTTVLGAISAAELRKGIDQLLGG